MSRLTKDQIQRVIPEGYRDLACGFLERVYLGESVRGLSLFEQAAGLVAGAVVSHPDERMRKRYLAQIHSGVTVKEFIDWVVRIEQVEEIVLGNRVLLSTLSEDLYAWMGSVVMNMLVSPSHERYTLMNAVFAKYGGAYMTDENRRLVFDAVISLLGEKVFKGYIQGLFWGFEGYSMKDFYSLGEEKALLVFKDMKEEGIFHRETPDQEYPDFTVVYKLLDYVKGTYQLHYGSSIDTTFNVGVEDFNAFWVPILRSAPSVFTDRHIRQLTLFFSRQLTSEALDVLSKFSR